MTGFISDLRKLKIIPGKWCQVFLGIFFRYFRLSVLNRYDYFKANHKKITGIQLLVIMRACLKALVEFHKTGHVHVDIKPHNILYNPETQTAKLIDFGGSYHHEDQTAFHGGGTKNYLAPELQRYNDNDNEPPATCS